MSSKKTTPLNIGLGLSGGGAKGIAHVGIIKALEQFNLKPEVISGVSAGAIVGALYADGKTPDDILSFFKEARVFKYVNISISRFGLVSSERFEKILNSHISAKTFEELKIPLTVNATELTEGKNIFFNSGPLIEKILASASVPIFINPRIIDNKIYVDGGIFNNMPCKVIRKQCKILFGSHVNPITTTSKKNLEGVLNITNRVYDLSIQSSTISEKRACDIVFEPVHAKNFGMFDTSNAEKIFNIGYSHAMQVLEDNQTKLEQLLNI